CLDSKCAYPNLQEVNMHFCESICDRSKPDLHHRTHQRTSACQYKQLVQYCVVREVPVYKFITWFSQEERPVDSAVKLLGRTQPAAVRCFHFLTGLPFITDFRIATTIRGFGESTAKMWCDYSGTTSSRVSNHCHMPGRLRIRRIEHR